MSMTNASTTFGAVRRPEVAHPRDEAARGDRRTRRSPSPDRMKVSSGRSLNRSATGRSAAASGCQPSASSAPPSESAGVSSAKRSRYLGRSAWSKPARAAASTSATTFLPSPVHLPSPFRPMRSRSSGSSSSGAPWRSKRLAWRRCAAAMTSSRPSPPPLKHCPRARLGRLGRVRRGRQRLSRRGGSSQRQSLPRGRCRDRARDAARCGFADFGSGRFGDVRGCPPSCDRRGHFHAPARCGGSGHGRPHRLHRECGYAKYSLIHN